MTELEAAVRLAIAALVGLGVGLEREWSGHTTGPNARFAGLRTLFLLGLVGGAGGILFAAGQPAGGAVVIAGGMALSVGAYLTAMRKPESDADGTTEAAALVVIALGTLAGLGWLALSAGAGAMVVLALNEKARLHWFVRRVSEREMRAALQFAVLALVVLPLLPEGPIGGWVALRPRSLWTIVLFFSALNFVGFLARRAVGQSAGYTLTGILGGIISSTGVTLDFSRKSRTEPELGGALASGVIGACTVLMPRVVIVSSVMNPAVGLSLIRLFWLPAVCGIVMLFIGWRRARDTTASSAEGVESPLRLRLAVQMAVVFQVAVAVIGLARRQWGATAVYPMAAALGLTDMDALTVSMSRTDGTVASDVASRAIAIGLIANTVVKLTLAAGLGVGQYRRLAVAGLGVLAIATAAGLLLTISL